MKLNKLNDKLECNFSDELQTVRKFYFSNLENIKGVDENEQGNIKQDIRQAQESEA